jgi:hypothetical protein
MVPEVLTQLVADVKVVAPVQSSFTGGGVYVTQISKSQLQPVGETVVE